MRTPTLVVSLLVGALLGCDADIETECVAGDCSPYEPVKPPIPETECYEGCDIVNPSGQTGEYPCAVDAIIDNCRRCHVPDKLDETFAPFSLDTYEDAQAIYFDKAIWARMEFMVINDFMPQLPPKLTDDEKQILLDDWACVCAPPRPEGQTCE